MTGIVYVVGVAVKQNAQIATTGNGMFQLPVKSVCLRAINTLAGEEVKRFGLKTYVLVVVKSLEHLNSVSLVINHTGRAERHKIKVATP